MESRDRPRLPVRVVIADDHPIFREGLIKLLETRPDLLVVGAAADGDDAMKLVAELDPDVLLLDLAMPRMAGLVALRELRGGPTRTRIISSRPRSTGRRSSPRFNSARRAWC